MGDPRMTLQLQAVLEVFFADPAQARYGLELCEATALPSGTIYVILARLEGCGWVESAWEASADYDGSGRPRRRYYTITDKGRAAAPEAINRAYGKRRRPPPSWVPA
ncbi:PadR family transcriptional regulator [Nonomuraea soli]|uniref:DNA-binding PadR family transcriptional regulator n=1 Tax=Nonomuraea soli TaxID=1032476 RepID=A0A7W0CHF9_9ACTN|nr:helix-turn-helix transcriptional regulator [Nonomuraea soli]MBA2891214.1 DNA-binding PadR family transcriptional regulator [Nonomuraea soli]